MFFVLKGIVPGTSHHPIPSHEMLDDLFVIRSQKRSKLSVAILVGNLGDFSGVGSPDHATVVKLLAWAEK